MRDKRRGLAALVLAAACGGPQSSPSQAISALPRDGITTAQRAEWHKHFPWPDDCEEAFRASQVGDDGGIRVVRLNSTVSIVEVTCAAGSYQPSVRRFTLTEGASGARIVPLSFPVYTSVDGRDLQRSQETEVWGESAVTPGAAEIAILTLARQTADCGVWTRYSLSDSQPRLLAAAARVRCANPPGTPVSLSPAAAPAGWDPISPED